MSLDECAESYLRWVQFDGIKREQLLFIAEKIIEISQLNPTPVPGLSRDAKRTKGPLIRWFYENRDTLTPWLEELSIMTIKPGRVTRKKK